MARSGRITLGFAALLAVSGLLWLTVWAVVVPVVRGWTPMVVMSGSMSPAINTGDVVIAAPYRGQDLATGSVIAFDSPTGEGELIHRVDGHTADGHFITKGDANAGRDSTSIDPGRVHGVGRVLVPFVGLPYVWVADGAWLHLAAAAAAVAAAARLSWTVVHRRTVRSGPIHSRPGPRPPRPERGGRIGGPPVPRDLRGSRLVGAGPRRPGPGAAASTTAAIALVLAMLAAGVTTTEPVDAAFKRPTTSTANGLLADVLNPPTALAANRGTAGQVNLSWTPTVDTYATGYEVYRSTTSGCCYSLLSSVVGRTTSSLLDSFGVPVPTVVNTTTASRSSSGTSLTIPVPSGVAAGDLLIAQVGTDNSSTFNTLTGWTRLVNATNSGFLGLGATSMGVWYRVATGSEPASYSFTWSNFDDAAGGMVAYRNIDTTTPIQGSATASGDTLNPQAPSLTTTATNTLVVRLSGADSNVLPSLLSTLYPSGLTGRWGVESGEFLGGVTVGVADKVQTTAGATGTANFTLSLSEPWLATTIAVNPAAPPTYYYVARATFLNWKSVSSAQV